MRDGKWVHEDGGEAAREKGLVLMSGVMDVSAFPVVKAVGGSWPTFTLADVQLGAGKWYFECTIIGVGENPQLGWADAEFKVSSSEGVGDDEHSWGCDGHRVKKWHKGDEDFGSKWAVGDVVGFAAEVQSSADGTTASFSFSLNGSWAAPWGAAFDSVPITGGLRPAFTTGRHSALKLNFGDTAFAYSAPTPEHRAVNAL